MLATLAVAALGASAVLVFSVLPASARYSRQAIAEIGDVEHVRTLLSGQSNDERGFLLSGDESFLDAFEAKGAEMQSVFGRLRRGLSPQERSLLDSAMTSYGRYLEQHERVLALARQGRRDEASALAVTDGRTVRLQTDHLLEATHDRVVAESRREQRDNRRRASFLTVSLLVLGLAPPFGAYVLGRTLRRLSEEEAALADRRRLAMAQQVARLGSWEHEYATGLTTWSDEMFRILGHEPGSLVPSVEAFVATTHPEDRVSVVDTIARAPSMGTRFAFRCRVVRPDGGVRWTETQGEFSFGPDGTPLAVFGTALDVTEREEAAEQIGRSRAQLVEQQAEMQHRAFHDALTGLANRALLLDRLEAAVDEGLPVAVMVLDLDGFKRVNDSLGHAVGDAVLQRLGERLTRTVQPATGGNTVARLGGDEFAVLLVAVDDHGALAVAERIITECSTPFTLADRRLALSASIGLAMGRGDVTAPELLRDADIAMYAAKDAGRNRCIVFEPEMRAAVVDRVALESELRAAIGSGGLAVHYQPVVDTASGVVVKVEALARWLHPERGSIGPDRFVPLAEETGLIGPLGAWVLQEACRELARHLDRRPDLKMAVNVSARQLDDDAFVTTVRAVLRETGVAPDRLVLEVTESALVEQDADARARLEALDELGVGLSIDDFGTGYSSLNRLRLLPAHELKIDKTFIDEVDDEGDRTTIVAAVIALAHGLGRTVVAEGVETPAQLESLVRLGCDTVQGFLCSRPLPPAELAELLVFPAPFAGLMSQDRPRPATDLDEVMAAVERAVREGGDLGPSVQPLLVELTRVTGMESAYVTAIVPENGTHEVVASYNAGLLDIREGRTSPWVDSLCHAAFTVGPRKTDDVARDYPANAVALAVGIRSYVMVPVTAANGRLLGSLCAASQAARAVDDQAVRLMGMFSRLIGQALDRRRNPLARGVRIVVVDDSSLVRRMIRRVLTAEPGIDVVAEAATADEAVAACREQQPDIVLLDLQMAGTDGLTVLPTLRIACPETRVVVLSAAADDRRDDAFALGAAAVVDKRDGLENLRETIGSVV